MSKSTPSASSRGSGIGGVSDESDDARAVGVEVRRERLVVVASRGRPSRRGRAALPRAGVDLDDQRAAAVLRHGEALGAAHPAQAGGEHPLPRERAAEMSCARLPGTSRR